MNYHTFVDWADAERWAIRRAKMTSGRRPGTTACTS
jgi:hypothetical protein